MSNPTTADRARDAALFGAETTENIVCIDLDASDTLWTYRRTHAGVVRDRAAFSPWILFTERPNPTVPGARYTELDGEGFHILAEFPTMAAFKAARFDAQQRHLATIAYPSAPKMAMLRSGQTLFKGMALNDIVRMQIDIETVGLDWNAEAGRILLIAVSDNRGLVEIIEGDEPTLLRQLVQRIIERDPDVIEGHNLFGFDLPFLDARARRHDIALAIGRDGSNLRTGTERNYAIGGATRPFTPWHIHGRHIIDTYLVVQRFDWAKGALASYGLKECARHFGFAQQDRIELPRAEMERLYREEPARVCEYARQDVVETQQLAALITPVEFYQTQMAPDNYGQVAVTGTGEKINSLFLRAYLFAGMAVPRPQASRPYAGAYTEVRRTGVIDRVVKADVESLYPSLMLANGIAPATDRLGVFLPTLRELTERRLQAKRKVGEAASGTSSADYDYWDGLQNSFKVLINSYYGYLGAPFPWNDYAAAERVTELGRTLVQNIAAQLEATGSDVIEIDTDGVYFTPPVEIADEAAERSYVAAVGKTMPDGIRLAFDGRFRRMLSLKTKNYVLETPEGKRIFKGASLRSRADERYGRSFLAQAIDRLMERDLQGVADLYASLIDDIRSRRIPIRDLAKRERVTDKTFRSGLKRRSAAVAEGVAVGEFVMLYERQGGALALLSDYDDDENVKYYIEKLYRFARRLEEAFEGQFDRYIPKPTAGGLAHQHQTALDLFD